MAQDARKIIIIGGGIAGLCAAVYAQKCGYQTVLLEQHTEPGGLATSWRRDGYRFETCLHWLLGSNPESDMYALWKEVFDIDRLTFINPDEFVRWEDETGQSLKIYSDAGKLEAELLSKAPQDAKEIGRFISAIRRCTDFPMPQPGASWFRQGLALLRMTPLLPLLMRLGGTTAAEYGRRFKHPLLRRLFTDGATGRMAALALVLPMAWMNGRNAGYAIGGARALIHLVAEKFHALGGQLRLASKADEILVENDAAVGVRLEGGEVIKADWVISAADGHATIYDLLGGRYKDETIDALYAKGESFPSYLQVSLGIAKDLSQEPAFVSRVLDTPFQLDPQTSLDALSLRFFHFDPTFAPHGKTAVTCFLPTYDDSYWVDLRRNDHAVYEAEKKRVADTVIAILERRLPGVHESIEVADVSTPATVVRYTGNWRGSMEGWLLQPGAGFRPMRQTLPGLQRFLMVGQWVQPGGGLPSGLMTARTALQAICRQDRVPFLPKQSGYDLKRAA
jgi:phytoene dehydrogenase-like protein